MKTLHRGLATLALWAALSAPAFALTKFPFPVRSYGGMPSFTVAYGRLFAAYVGPDDQLHVAQSLDGTTFVGDNVVPGAGRIAGFPSIAYYQGKLFVAYAEYGTLYLHVVSSANGLTFNAPVSVGTNRGWWGASLAASPTRLFVVFAGVNNSRLNVVQSLDGVTWTNQYVSALTGSTPQAAFGNGYLWVTYKGTNSALSYITSPDGSHWSAPTVYDGSYGTPNTSTTDAKGGTAFGPSITFVDGVANLVWTQTGVLRIQEAFGAAPVYLASATDNYPAVYAFNGTKYVTFFLNGNVYIAEPGELNVLP